jgi:D-sedoheptulose 7-phosphate isomerase
MRTLQLDNVEGYLDRLRGAIDALPRDRLALLGEMLYRAYSNEKQVFTLGNGGSASTASHMAADIGKNTIGANMGRFRVLSLNDNMATVTAIANDLGYENVFGEQLKNLVRAGDLVIAISGSGNSPNILNGMRCARAACAEVAAILGFDGGKALDLADVAVVIPSSDYGVVEDAHLIINHIIVDYFKARLAEDQPWVVG